MKTLIDFFNFGMMRNYADIIPNVDPNTKRILNLGPGNKHIHGSYSHYLELPWWNAETDPIPADDNSIQQIHAYHFLEHIQNIVPLLAECQRVLDVNGHMNIVVPHYRSQLAIEDVDHKRMFCEDTWKTLFKGEHAYKGNIHKLAVAFNLLMGDSHNNLCIFTQLVKVEP